MRAGRTSVVLDAEHDSGKRDCGGDVVPDPLQLWGCGAWGPLAERGGINRRGMSG
jgi:hypothetical protein